MVKMVWTCSSTPFETYFVLVEVIPCVMYLTYVFISAWLIASTHESDVTYLTCSPMTPKYSKVSKQCLQTSWNTQGLQIVQACDRID